MGYGEVYWDKVFCFAKLRWLGAPLRFALLTYLRKNEALLLTVRRVCLYFEVLF